MEAITNLGKYANTALFVFIIIITLLPIISLFGHLFSSEGRAELFSNFFLVLYFLVFGGYFYLFWFNQDLLLEFGIPRIYQTLIYAFLAMLGIIEKKVPT